MKGKCKGCIQGSYGIEEKGKIVKWVCESHFFLRMNTRRKKLAGKKYLNGDNYDEGVYSVVA